MKFYVLFLPSFNKLWVAFAIFQLKLFRASREACSRLMPIERPALTWTADFAFLGQHIVEIWFDVSAFVLKVWNKYLWVQQFQSVHVSKFIEPSQKNNILLSRSCRIMYWEMSLLKLKIYLIEFILIDDWKRKSIALLPSATCFSKTEPLEGSQRWWIKLHCLHVTKAKFMAYDVLQTCE